MGNVNFFVVLIIHFTGNSEPLHITVYLIVYAPKTFFFWSTYICIRQLLFRCWSIGGKIHVEFCLFRRTQNAPHTWPVWWCSSAPYFVDDFMPPNLIWNMKIRTPCEMHLLSRTQTRGNGNAKWWYEIARENCRKVGVKYACCSSTEGAYDDAIRRFNNFMKIRLLVHYTMAEYNQYDIYVGFSH